MERLPRRTLLDAALAGGSAALAGCTSVLSPSRSDPPCEQKQTEQITERGTATGDPLTLAHAVAEQEPFDRPTYYESNDTVRHAITHTRAGTGNWTASNYRTTPWRTFAHDRAEQRAIEGIRSELESTHGDLPSVGVAPSPNLDTGLDAQYRVELQDGCVASEPGVNYDSLRETTPARVTVTVTLDEQSRTVAFDVGVRKVFFEAEE